MDPLEKSMPSAPEAERAILGACLITPNIASLVATSLRAADFHNAINRAIFLKICDMVNEGVVVEPILLAGRLREEHEISDALLIINELTYGPPACLSVDLYIEQVKEKRKLRRCIKKAQKLIARVNDGDSSSSEIAQAGVTAFDELVQESSTSNPSLVSTYSAFMQNIPSELEVLACHASRGELVVIQSVTNKGKSTFSRNGTMSLATGTAFAPFVEKGTPRKVLLLNLEGAQTRFQKDLQAMANRLSGSDMELLEANLSIVHAPIIQGSSFTLSKHLPLIKSEGRRIKPDVIIIDTLAAAFTIRSENDNAEMQGIMKTLIGLAQSLNCLVIVVHHIGKAKLEDGRTSEGAHRGRGASTVGDFATTIVNLEADATDQNRVTVRFAKRKDGEKYERILILDRESRWFSMVYDLEPRPLSSNELFEETMRNLNGMVSVNQM